MRTLRAQLIAEYRAVKHLSHKSSTARQLAGHALDRGMTRLDPPKMHHSHAEEAAALVAKVMAEEHQAAEIAAILQALHQVLHGLESEAGRGPASYQEFIQVAMGKVRNAVQSISTALAREEAATGSVRRACNRIVRRDACQDDRSVFSLVWVDDTCGSSVRELFLVAALWQRIGNEAFACGGPLGSVIQYRCFQQMRRITKLALDSMDRQLEAQRKQGRLNPVERFGTTLAELQEAIALEQYQQIQEAARKEGKA